MFIENMFEYYTSITGWYMNNVIFSLISLLGLPIIPFAYVVIKNVMQAKRSDFSNSPGILALKDTEVDFMRMFAVIILLLVPIIELEVNYLDKAPNICPGVNIKDTVDAKIKENELISKQYKEVNIASINNIQSKVPILIGLIQTISTGISYVVTKSIPCFKGYNITSMKMGNMHLKNTNDQLFAHNFLSQCYNQTLRYVISNDEFIKADSPKTSPTGYFLEKNYSKFEMLYNNNYWNSFINSSDKNIDENSEININCFDAYNHLYALAIKRSDEIFKDLKNEAQNVFENLYKQGHDPLKSKKIRAQDIKVDIILGATQNNDSGLKIIERDVIDLSWLDEIGAIFSTANDILGSSIVQLTNPMLLAISQMLFTILIPIFLVCSNYSIKMSLAILSGIFTLEFTNSIFALGSWINETLTTLIINDETFNKSTNILLTNDGLSIIVFTKIAFMCHTFLPIAYLTLMSTLGFFSSGALQTMSVSRSAGTDSANKSSAFVKSGINAISK